MDNFNEVITVGAVGGSYPVYIGEGFSGLLEEAGEAGLSGARAVVVTDSNVAPLYLEDVCGRLSGAFSKVERFVFPAGEKSKTLSTVRDMLSFFLDKKLDRKSAVFALGGGVCGDMAGFAAAVYMRGAPYAQIPTTLLSQVDSAVGGKTGVDLGAVKNAVGAFYQPKFVHVNVSALKTLPKEQFLSGLGEVVKHGIIGGGGYFDALSEKRGAILALETDALKEAVAGSCLIKSSVVAADEREENGVREILNFGHTFGHAVEADSGFNIPHGVCVAIGMRAALRLSRDTAGLSREESERALDLIASFGLETSYRPNTAGAGKRLLELMYSDKKVKNGRLSAVIIDAIGKARGISGVTESGLLAALGEILAE
jgi:3-dehydroquinate synthase